MILNTTEKKIANCSEELVELEAYLIGSVDIGALSDQELDETDVAVRGCRVERRSAGGIDCGQQRRRAAQQQTGNGAMSADTRQVQRCQALQSNVSFYVLEYHFCCGSCLSLGDRYHCR